MRLTALCLLVAMALGLPRAGFAGIADRALPQFADGKPSVLVMVVPGVVKRGRLQTDFICVSVDSQPVNVGVEVFDAAGTVLNDIRGGAGVVLGVAPGRTVTIGTSATKTYLESTVIPLAGVAQGAARIVASSDRVRCNVVVVDDAVSPPVSLATLSAGVRPVADAPPGALPLPRFASGRQATHAVNIPGAVKRGRMQTDVVCTSLAVEPIDLGVEVFGPDASQENRVSEGNGAILNVPPGATVTLGTTGSAGLLESAVIPLRGVAQGFARVVSTSGGVACTALVLDSAVSPPAAISGLTQ